MQQSLLTPADINCFAFDLVNIDRWMILWIGFTCADDLIYEIKQWAQNPMFHGILYCRMRSMENTSFQMTITHFVSILTPPNGSKKFRNFTQRISTHLNVWYSNFQHMVEKVNVVVYQFLSWFKIIITFLFIPKFSIELHFTALSIDVSTKCLSICFSIC